MNAITTGTAMIGSAPNATSGAANRASSITP